MSAAPTSDRVSADHAAYTGPHRIVIVGGGAGGLELATRLGDTLGRKGLAHVTLIENQPCRPRPGRATGHHLTAPVPFSRA